MKKSLSLLALVLMCVFAVTASAEIFTTTVEQIDVKLDKNGKEYVRLIVPMAKSEGGINYNVSLPAMCFAQNDDTSLIDYAKTLKPGDVIKFAGSMREWNGRSSITVHKFAQ